MAYASYRQILNYSPLHFFFNDTATTEIYTLSLHDALPILIVTPRPNGDAAAAAPNVVQLGAPGRSEEHTSELQSRRDLVCRLLLEKKKKSLEIKIQTICEWIMSLTCSTSGFYRDAILDNISPLTYSYSLEDESARHLNGIRLLQTNSQLLATSFFF